MVTTTVRMLDGVHGHTTNLGPRVPLSLVLEGALPAFNRGLSILPPPATMPTIARLLEGIVFFDPDGNFTFDLPTSGLWVMMVA